MQRLFNHYGKDIAAVIVEPICGNMGVILPEADFLAASAQNYNTSGALLIFDEVITGFRVALGGAQEVFKLKPDLTCLGKILGGGLPLAAFGGRRKIMDLFAPLGRCIRPELFQAIRLAVAPALKHSNYFASSGTYESLEAKGKRLKMALETLSSRHGIRATINRVGSMLTLFFGVDRVQNADDARSCDRQKFADYFHFMLAVGIYLPPAPFEAMFVSLAHSNADLDGTISRV